MVNIVSSKNKSVHACMLVADDNMKSSNSDLIVGHIKFLVSVAFLSVSYNSFLHHRSSNHRL